MRAALGRFSSGIMGALSLYLSTGYNGARTDRGAERRFFKTARPGRGGGDSCAPAGWGSPYGKCQAGSPVISSSRTTREASPRTSSGQGKLGSISAPVQRMEHWTRRRGDGGHSEVCQRPTRRTPLTAHISFCGGGSDNACIALCSYCSGRKEYGHEHFHPFEKFSR
jgi:hypothetical protein